MSATVCPVIGCQAKFSNVARHTEHMQVGVHNPSHPSKHLVNMQVGNTDQTYLCPVCFETTPTIQECFTHMRKKKHGGTTMRPLTFGAYACPQCLILFPKSEHVTIHMEQKQHKQILHNFLGDLETTEAQPLVMPRVLCAWYLHRCIKTPWHSHCISCKLDINRLDRQKLQEHLHCGHRVQVVSASNNIEVFKHFIGNYSCDSCKRIFRTLPESGLGSVHECSSGGATGIYISNDCNTLQEFIIRLALSFCEDPQKQYFPYQKVPHLPAPVSIDGDSLVIIGEKQGSTNVPVRVKCEGHRHSGVPCTCNNSIQGYGLETPSDSGSELDGPDAPPQAALGDAVVPGDRASSSNGSVNAASLNSDATVPTISRLRSRPKKQDNKKQDKDGYNTDDLCDDSDEGAFGGYSSEEEVMPKKKNRSFHASAAATVPAVPEYSSDSDTDIGEPSPPKRSKARKTPTARKTAPGKCNRSIKKKQKTVSEVSDNTLMETMLRQCHLKAIVKVKRLNVESLPQVVKVNVMVQLEQAKSTSPRKRKRPAVEEEPMSAVKEEPMSAVKEEPMSAVRDEPIPPTVSTEPADLNKYQLIVFLDLDVCPKFFQQIPDMLPPQAFLWGFRSGEMEWKPPRQTDKLKFYNDCYNDGRFLLQKQKDMQSTEADEEITRIVTALNTQLDVTVKLLVIGDTGVYEELQQQIAEATPRRVYKLLDPSFIIVDMMYQTIQSMCNVKGTGPDNHTPSDVSEDAATTGGGR